MDKTVYEIRINKTEMRPKCAKFVRWRKWRWDVTAYRPIEGNYPGVYDCRLHLGSTGVGYTFTKLGASIAAGKRVGSSYV